MRSESALPFQVLPSRQRCAEHSTFVRQSMAHRLVMYSCEGGKTQLEKVSARYRSLAISGRCAHLEVERDELESLANALVALGVDELGVLADERVEPEVLRDERMNEEEAVLRATRNQQELTYISGARLTRRSLSRRVMKRRC